MDDLNKEDEVILFGWIVFDSEDARNLANQLVAADPRMAGDDADQGGVRGPPAPGQPR